ILEFQIQDGRWFRLQSASGCSKHHRGEDGQLRQIPRHYSLYLLRRSFISASSASLTALKAASQSILAPAGVPFGALFLYSFHHRRSSLIRLASGMKT